MAIIGASLIIWDMYLIVIDENGFTYPNNILTLLSGGISIIVAIGYWSKNAWAPYLHFISIIQLALLIILPARDIASHWYYLAIIVASFTQLISMTITLRCNKIFIAIIFAVVLASASFFYQKIGPSVGIYGTECKDQPHGYCYGPLLGAGFPFQFVLDFPGISVVGTIGYEDNVIQIMFLADVFIYCVIIYAGLELARFVKEAKERNHRPTPL
jgi:hypothetical protein